jgi:hypothetical protein
LGHLPGDSVTFEEALAASVALEGWESGSIINVQDKSVGQLAMIETKLIFQEPFVLGCTLHTVYLFKKKGRKVTN